MQTSIDRLLRDGCHADGAGKVCRSRGGESCAFDGAMIVLQPIADAVHVVHGPLSCCTNSWEGRGSRSSVGDLHHRGFCTDIGELDIVYGAGERLSATVREAVAEAAPSAVFVHTTCVTGLIGEDIDAACVALSAELGLPVVPVHAPGFVGPKNLGNRLAGEALLEHVIGTAEPPDVTPTDIVLIGEYNIAGDLDLVEPLLREAGIRVLARITGNARFEELRWAHRARVAALVCSRALMNVSAELERRWGVPGVEVSFFGRTETARSLRAIADLLEDVSPGARGVRERVEAVIAAHETRLERDLAPYASLRGKRAVLYSGGVKSWSMVSALRDLGIEVLAVGTKKATYEDEEKVRALMGADAPVVPDISPARIRRIMTEKHGDLLVAGGRNRYLAAKEGWPFVDVNQERHTPYTGYDGLVNLARDLHQSMRFYERARCEALERPRPPAPPVIVPSPRQGSIDPIGDAASLGAVLAMQGVHHAMPLLHGAQGCDFLEKVLLCNHFNEPVALSDTKLFTEQVVLGGEQAIADAVHRLATTSAPRVIAVITTALPEVKGDDVTAAVIGLRREGHTVLAVHAPDYDGGLEDGYLSAVQALLGVAEPGDTDPLQVTVLAGSHLTPAETVWLREAFEDFGLVPVFVPDLGVLDGSRGAHSPIALGGVTVDELREVGRSVHTLAIGTSLAPAARSLTSRFGTPCTVLDGISGLAATDRLVDLLASLSGQPVGSRLRRRRARLLDTMRDAHAAFAGARIALALEADHALQISLLLEELGADTTAVVPRLTGACERIRAREVRVGDHLCIPEGVDLLIGGSHATGAARRLGIPLVEIGFPVLKHLGASRTISIGYDGSAALVDRLANLLLDTHAMTQVFERPRG